MSPALPRPSACLLSCLETLVLALRGTARGPCNSKRTPRRPFFVRGGLRSFLLTLCARVCAGFYVFVRGRAARVQNGQVGTFGVRPPNARLEGRAGHLSSRKCAHVCGLEMCHRSPRARSACCGSFRRQSVHVVAAGVISVILGLVVHVIGWLPSQTRDHRITWDTRRELGQQI